MYVFHEEFRDDGISVSMYVAVLKQRKIETLSIILCGIYFVYFCLYFDVSDIDYTANNWSLDSIKICLEYYIVILYQYYIVDMIWMKVNKVYHLEELVVEHHSWFQVLFGDFGIRCWSL